MGQVSLRGAVYVNRRESRLKVRTVAACVGYKKAIEIIKILQRKDPGGHYYMATAPTKNWEEDKHILIR